MRNKQIRIGKHRKIMFMILCAALLTLLFLKTSEAKVGDECYSLDGKTKGTIRPLQCLVLEGETAINAYNDRTVCCAKKEVISKDECEKQGGTCKKTCTSKEQYIKGCNTGDLCCKLVPCADYEEERECEENPKCIWKEEKCQDRPQTTSTSCNNKDETSCKADENCVWVTGYIYDFCGNKACDLRNMHYCDFDKNCIWKDNKCQDKPQTTSTTAPPSTGNCIKIETPDKPTAASRFKAGGCIDSKGNFHLDECVQDDKGNYYVAEQICDKGDCKDFVSKNPAFPSETVAGRSVLSCSFEMADKGLKPEDYKGRCEKVKVKGEVNGISYEKEAARCCRDENAVCSDDRPCCSDLKCEKVGNDMRCVKSVQKKGAGENKNCDVILVSPDGFLNKVVIPPSGSAVANAYIRIVNLPDEAKSGNYIGELNCNLKANPEQGYIKFKVVPNPDWVKGNENNPSAVGEGVGMQIDSNGPAFPVCTYDFSTSDKVIVHVVIPQDGNNGINTGMTEDFYCNVEVAVEKEQMLEIIVPDVVYLGVPFSATVRVKDVDWQKRLDGWKPGVALHSGYLMITPSPIELKNGEWKGEFTIISTAELPKEGVKDRVKIGGTFGEGESAILLEGDSSEFTILSAGKKDEACTKDEECAKYYEEEKDGKKYCFYLGKCRDGRCAFEEKEMTAEQKCTESGVCDPSTKEICDNKIDDDCDSKIDCEDADCYTQDKKPEWWEEKNDLVTDCVASWPDGYPGCRLAQCGECLPTGKRCECSIVDVYKPEESIATKSCQQVADDACKIESECIKAGGFCMNRSLLTNFNCDDTLGLESAKDATGNRIDCVDATGNVNCNFACCKIKDTKEETEESKKCGYDGEQCCAFSCREIEKDGKKIQLSCCSDFTCREKCVTPTSAIEKIIRNEDGSVTVYATLTDGTYVKIEVDKDGKIIATYTDGNVADDISKEDREKKFVKDDSAKHTLYENLIKQIQDYLNRKKVERPGSRNLLKNPGFQEDDKVLKEWTSEGDVVIDAEQKSTKNSAKLTKKGDEDLYIFQKYCGEEVRTDKKYLVRVYAKTDGEAEFEIVFLIWKKLAIEEKEKKVVSVKEKTEWQQYEISSGITEDTECIGVEFKVNKGTVWFDDAELVVTGEEEEKEELKREEQSGNKILGGECVFGSKNAAETCDKNRGLECVGEKGATKGKCECKPDSEWIGEFCFKIADYEEECLPDTSKEFGKKESYDRGDKYCSSKRNMKCVKDDASGKYKCVCEKENMKWDKTKKSCVVPPPEEKKEASECSKFADYASCNQALNCEWCPECIKSNEFGPQYRSRPSSNDYGVNGVGLYTGHPGGACVGRGKCKGEYTKGKCNADCSDKKNEIWYECECKYRDADKDGKCQEIDENEEKTGKLGRGAGCVPNSDDAAKSCDNTQGLECIQRMKNEECSKYDDLGFLRCETDKNCEGACFQGRCAYADDLRRKICESNHNYEQCAGTKTCEWIYECLGGMVDGEYKKRWYYKGPLPVNSCTSLGWGQQVGYTHFCEKDKCDAECTNNKDCKSATGEQGLCNYYCKCIYPGWGDTDGSKTDVKGTCTSAVGKKTDWCRDIYTLVEHVFDEYEYTCNARNYDCRLENKRCFDGKCVEIEKTKCNVDSDCKSLCSVDGRKIYTSNLVCSSGQCLRTEKSKEEECGENKECIQKTSFEAECREKEERDEGEFDKCIFNMPYDIATAYDSDGNTFFFVTDTNNNRVVVFDKELKKIMDFGTGTSGNTNGKKGSDIGEFNEPTGIAAFTKEESGTNSYQRVYVSDTNNRRLQGFIFYDKDKRITNYKMPITGINMPLGTAADGSTNAGQIFLADAGSNKILIIDAEKLEKAGEITGFEGLRDVFIDISQNGNKDIYVTDKNEIKVFENKQGYTLKKKISGFEELNSVATTDNLFIYAAGRTKVYRINKEKPEERSEITIDKAEIRGIAVTAEALYIVDSKNSKIIVYDKRVFEQESEKKPLATLGPNFCDGVKSQSSGESGTAGAASLAGTGNLPECKKRCYSTLDENPAECSSYNEYGEENCRGYLDGWVGYPTCWGDEPDKYYCFCKCAGVGKYSPDSKFCCRGLEYSDEEQRCGTNAIADCKKCLSQKLFGITLNKWLNPGVMKYDGPNCYSVLNFFVKPFKSQYWVYSADKCEETKISCREAAVPS